MMRASHSVSVFTIRQLFNSSLLFGARAELDEADGWPGQNGVFHTTSLPGYQSDVAIADVVVRCDWLPSAQLNSFELLG